MLATARVAMLTGSAAGASRRAGATVVSAVRGCRSQMAPAISSLSAAARALSGSAAVHERFKIYTKTGDEGTSMLFSGQRKPKDDAVFNALGCADELSSFVGLAREHCLEAGNALPAQLEEVQCRLQELGSHIATPRDSASDGRKARTGFEAESVATLERWIDEMDEELPPLANFILPSGGQAGATLHCCRSICRRAERDIVPLIRDKKIEPEAYKFVNRLSDYFFTAARYAAQFENKEETIFKPTR